MTQPTKLDKAHGAMAAAPDDAALRMEFYQCLADSELFVLLEDEASEGQIRPRILDTGDARYVPVFDTEERLAGFTGEVSEFAALSGRTISAMFAGRGLGLVLNPGVAPSSFPVPEAALSWLNDTLENGPRHDAGVPDTFAAPDETGAALVPVLCDKLGQAAGLVKTACLVAVTYTDNRRAHMLAIVDVAPPVRDAIAKAVSEVVIFHGTPGFELDVAFVDAGDPVRRHLDRVGHWLDIPEKKTPEPRSPVAPGRDPDAPPILR
jgi:hypothetical protein